MLNKKVILHFILILSIVCLFFGNWISIPIIDNLLSTPFILDMLLSSNKLTNLPQDDIINLFSISQLVLSTQISSSVLQVLAYGLFIVSPLILTALFIWFIIKNFKKIPSKKLGYVIYSLPLVFSILFMVIVKILNTNILNRIPTELSSRPIFAGDIFETAVTTSYSPYLICVLSIIGLVIIFINNRNIKSKK